MRKGAHLLCQRAEHELPLWDADVWDFESLVVDNLILVEENIKVYIPWPLVNYLLAAHGVLDILELVQEVKRLQGGLDLFRVSLLAKWMMGWQAETG